MKSPYTGGKVTKKSRTEVFNYRGESFSVKAFYYQCKDTGRKFTNAEIDDLFMKELHRLYREKHSIPSPDELRQLREKYGFSAHTMSKIAGFGINQYGRYENGEMPTIPMARRLSSLFNKDLLLESVDRSKFKLGKDYEKVRATIEAKHESQTFRVIEKYYNDFRERLSSASNRYSTKKTHWAYV